MEPQDIVEEFLYREFVHAIPVKDDYETYLGEVEADYPNAELIAVMGSGNWCFSLNPDKNFRRFSEQSDIDLVIICEKKFHETWEELRKYHRNNYYLLDKYKKSKLKRNGENVYSGFISPRWIFDKASSVRFDYEIRTNKYSNKIVGYRKVNMMYFKNTTEAIDYYARGFRLARGRIQYGI